MAQPVPAIATYADLQALPPHVVGEIVDGRLYVSPRPGLGHANVASALGEELGPPFRRGRGGPGGWVILDEPELHLARDVVVPDLAGWRRARMPEVPVEDAFTTLAPDWACEVLSRSTAGFDRGHKLAVYAREQVAHVWLIDPAAATLEVLRLDGPTYRVVLVATGDAAVAAEPFDAVALSLATLWAR